MFRISLLQLTLLTTGIATLSAWLFQDRDRTLVWLEYNLSYAAPAIPNRWNRNLPTTDRNGNRISHHAPEILKGIQVTTGSELFQTGHRRGWETCRYHYYSEYDVQKYAIQSSFDQIDVTQPDQINSAATLAYAHGYNDCLAQIRKLLLLQTPNQLRRSLARKKGNSLPILLVSLGSLTAFFLTLIRRPKSQKQAEKRKTDSG